MANYPQSRLVSSLFMTGHRLVFAKGDTILGNDTTPDGVYFIEYGYAKIYSLSDEGDEYLHVILGSGELFPLVWAFLGIEPEALFYEAIAPTVLWRISREQFSAFLETTTANCHALAMQLAQQQRIYMDRLENLEYKRAPARIAYRLLYLANRFGVKRGNTIVIDAPITHEIFANSINLARESVSREVEELEEEGIIKQSGRRIIICDAERLLGKLSQPISLKDWRL